MTPRLDALIPIKAGTNDTPLVKWEPYQSRIATPEEIAEWDRRWPERNRALVTGALSGIIVIDVDPRHGGDQTIKGYPMPPTRVVRTRSGGFHYYFLHPGFPVPNAAPLLDPGVDLRGDGGYVMVPPSRSGEGAYEVLLDAPIAPLPDWVPAAIATRQHGQKGNGQAPNGQRFTDVELAALLAGVPEGRRDIAATRLAGRYFGRGLARTEVVGFLRAWNTENDPPLDDATLLKCVTSIEQREQRKTPEEPHAPVTFTVLTARALSALPDPDTDALLLGPVLVRAGRTVIGAHTGHGKTTFALQMVKAVVTQSDCLGWSGAGGRALVLDAEQGLRTIKRRLVEAGLEDSDQVDFLRVPDGLSLDKSAEEVAAVEAVLRVGHYAVVFADPLYKLHTGNSNDEREAVDLMRIFDRWREEYRFALLLATHIRKAPALGARFSMHEFFGSSAYLRGAEVVLGLEFLRPGFSRLHFFKDRDGDLPVGTHWNLLFSRDQGFTRGADVDKPTAADKVRDLLLRTPSMTEADLAKATSNAERTIRDALKSLAAVSSTGPDKTKFWSLPPQETSSE